MTRSSLVLMLSMSFAGGTRAAPAGLPSSPAPEHALPSVALPAALQRVLDEYEVAWQARDAAALAALFAEDGFVLSAGRAPVRGRDAIRRWYQGSGGPLALRAWHFAGAGDVAYILGGYARTRGGPDVGKFTLTLRQGAGGRFLIVSDMDNDNGRRE